MRACLITSPSFPGKHVRKSAKDCKPKEKISNLSFLLKTENIDFVSPEKLRGKGKGERGASMICRCSDFIYALIHAFI